MKLLSINTTQLNQLFWVILIATLVGLFLATLIKKRLPLSDVLRILLSQPIIALPLVVFGRLLLLDSELVARPPVVAFFTLGFLASTVGIMGLELEVFKDHNARFNAYKVSRDGQDLVLYNRGVSDVCSRSLFGLGCDVALLVTTFDVLTNGGEVTCWIWLLVAALQILLLWISFAEMVVRYAIHWHSELGLVERFRHDILTPVDTAALMIEPDAKSAVLSLQWRYFLAGSWRLLLGFLIIVSWASYCATGLMRNAATKYYGSPEPGGLWERAEYNTRMKVTVHHPGTDPGHEGTLAETTAKVVNHGIFWERERRIHLKSVSFVKGRPQRIQYQDDELWPQQGRTMTDVTTERGVSVRLGLTKDEDQRFSR